MKNAIRPIILTGLCNTTSLSNCPKPPTFGSEVSASPDLISSFSLTIIWEPIGKTSVDISPFSSLIFTFRVPSSLVFILLMIPL